MKSKNKSVAVAYLGIISVIMIWGLIPSVKKALIGGAFSASVYMVITTFSAALVLLIISAKHIKEINRSYFKVAIPTGLSVGVAAIVQALAYNFSASPVNQAFLENLSCIVVPLILLVFIKKRPNLLTVVACIVCLFSSAVLTGMFDGGVSFSTADILNALAGVFYGINIAFTGIFAKKFNATLYVMIQMFTQCALSFVGMIVLNLVSIGGSIVDPIIFTPKILLILAVVGVGIVTNSVCWTIRTSAMKYVSPTVVAVIMPFSAVITGLFAVIIGQDTLSSSLVIGAVLGIFASVASGIADLPKKLK